LKRHKFGGISTIEQQLVRTIRKRREYTISRKFSEITLSILMNFHFTKAEILTTYLNCVYFGPHMNGVDTAALVSFGVPAISLTEEQADFIACLLPTPMPRNIALSLRKYGPALNPETILTNFELTNPWWVNSVRTRNRVLSLAKIKYSKLYAKASR
jgi:membrane peptidoglycan carboxypeptidase